MTHSITTFLCDTNCVCVCACVRVVVTVCEYVRDAAWRAVLTIPGQRLLPFGFVAAVAGRSRMRPCGQQLERFQCVLAPGQRSQSGASQQMLREIRDTREQ